MLPRKMFENLHAGMAILVLFELFSGKLCSNFLTQILSASPNMIPHIFNYRYACLRPKAYCYQRRSKL